MRIKTVFSLLSGAARECAMMIRRKGTFPQEVFCIFSPFVYKNTSRRYKCLLGILFQTHATSLSNDNCAHFNGESVSQLKKQKSRHVIDRPPLVISLDYLSRCWPCETRALYGNVQNPECNSETLQSLDLRPWRKTASGEVTPGGQTHGAQ